MNSHLKTVLQFVIVVVVVQVVIVVSFGLEFIKLLRGFSDNLQDKISMKTELELDDTAAQFAEDNTATDKEWEGTFDGFKAGYREAEKDLGWKYFEDGEPDWSQELLIVYYVNDVRHLGVSWRSKETFERDILSKEPQHMLHAYRYLLEPVEYTSR